MDKKESFKNFARNHPELLTSIKSGEGNWQKFYEIYDIYGEDSSVWNDYSRKETVNTDSGVSKINELFKTYDGLILPASGGIAPLFNQESDKLSDRYLNFLL